MSFARYKKVIEEGDTVILFLGFDNMLQFIVDASKTHQTRYGALKHRDLIGVAYGSKVQCTKGYAHVLHPTPELWTQTLPHRTQILYSTDISFIVLQLDLKPGCIVVESGTGSGSLSHALLRTITPGGYLHTYDFHEQRVEKARAEFEEHGFGESVTVTHKDVLAEGFDLENVADAVFLDLPAPWDAIHHAKKALKPGGGRLCSFSPCIEQVQRACEKLTELGFCDLYTCECLSRSFDVRTANMPMPDLGYPVEDSSASGVMDRGGSYHHPAIGMIERGEPGDYSKKKKGKWQNQKKGGQGDSAKSSRDGVSTKQDDQDADSATKAKSGHDGELTKQVGQDADLAKQAESGHMGESTTKSVQDVDSTKSGPEDSAISKDQDSVQKMEDGADDSKCNIDSKTVTKQLNISDKRGDKRGDKRPNQHVFDKSSSYVFKTGIAPHQMPGHTGYLTFATLLPP